MGSVISKILDEEREYRPLFKPVNKESVIKWQTGTPKESGEYLVSLEDGTVCRDEWRKLYCDDEIQCWVYNEGEVIAWCKLSDIEPYMRKQYERFNRNRTIVK